MASAAFSIDPGTGTPGGSLVQQTAAAGATIILELDSISGVDSVSWRTVGTHASAVTTASIDALMALTGSPNGKTCTLTLPAGTEQAYGFECTINAGTSTEATARCAVRVLNDSGKAPVFAGETTEAGVGGWVDAINDAIDNTGIAVQTLAGRKDLSSPGAGTAVDSNWSTLGLYITPAGWEPNTVEIVAVGSTNNATGTVHLALFDTGLNDSGGGSLSPVEVANTEIDFGTSSTMSRKSTGDIFSDLAANKVYVLQIEMYGDAPGTDVFELVGAEIRHT